MILRVLDSPWLFWSNLLGVRVMPFQPQRGVTVIVVVVVVVAVVVFTHSYSRFGILSLGLRGGGPECWATGAYCPISQVMHVS